MEAAEGYIQWYYDVSRPRMIHSDMEVSVSRPLEWETINEIAAQEDGEHGFLELGGRLGHIRDLVYDVMPSGEVQRGSEAWQHLEEVLREVYGGKVYHRRKAVEGVRGDGVAEVVGVEGVVAGV